MRMVIKSDFAIFRVVQLAEDRFHREVLVALFNGYGSELNVMRPGRPERIPEEYRVLGRVTEPLRQTPPLFSSVIGGLSCRRQWTASG